MLQSFLQTLNISLLNATWSRFRFFEITSSYLKEISCNFMSMGSSFDVLSKVFWLHFDWMKWLTVKFCWKPQRHIRNFTAWGHTLTDVCLYQMKSKFDQILWIGSSLDPLSNEQYAPRTKVKIQLEIEFRIAGTNFQLWCKWASIKICPNTTKIEPENLQTR